MNIKQALKSAHQQLRSKTETPDLDAEILLAYVLQQSRTYLRTWPEQSLTPAQQQQFENYLQRRSNGEPIPYITGIKEFWSLELTVTPETLIPRSETELLVEIVLQRFSDKTHLALADMGTGSGAIAIALASERPSWDIYATDQSAAALRVAYDNAQRLQFTNIHFCEGSWLSALPNKKFDVIVSNPPYISEQEWEQYSKGLTYEPTAALLSGKDGLADIDAILSAAINYLKPDGYLIFEHGFAQGEAVRQLFVSYGYKSVETVLDLAGHERVTLGRCKVV